MDDRVKVKFSKMELEIINAQLKTGEYPNRVAVIREAVRRLSRVKNTARKPSKDIAIQDTISLRLNTKWERDKIKRWMIQHDMSQNGVARKMLFERFAEQEATVQIDKSSLRVMQQLVKVVRKRPDISGSVIMMDLIGEMSDFLTMLDENN